MLSNSTVKWVKENLKFLKQEANLGNTELKSNYEALNDLWQHYKKYKKDSIELGWYKSSDNMGK